MKLKVSIILLLLTSLLSAQQYVLKGKVVDKPTSSPLSYSNIRIAGTTLGTAANYEGNFELRLSRGNYKIIASVIGYRSDTITVVLGSNKTINFSLEPVQVNLQEITVFPGENPALEIIRRAIDSKHERNNKLNTYEFHAYTKGLVKTTKNFSSRNNSASLSIGAQDTGKLKISGIIENESKGYFKKPNNYKDEILARKQSANTPSSVNILTGGRIIQNFYTDDIQFFNRPLPSPISDDAIDYYDYLIEDTLAMDNKNVFQIHIEPIKKADPGFVGKIFISDDQFSLVKIDVNLNDAANPGRIFNRVNIFQQYTPYENNIYMPVDYRIFADGNFIGIFKFGFELNTIFYDYKINSLIEDDLFGMAIVKVLSDADKKDSTYWKSTQTISNTNEELEAYKRIDSLEAIPRTFWDNFSFLSASINVNDNLSVTGPLGLYSFNPIEGHTLNFGASISQEADKRLNSRIDLSYGFDDQRFKTDFSSTFFMGEYRTNSITVNAFTKLTELFGESIRYNKLTSTLSNLFGKYDFKDYYYTKGFSIKLWSEVFPVLRLSLGLLNRTDNNAYNNSDFSIFNKDKKYNINKTIYETRINAFTAGFQLDFRKYIEDGYFRRRTSQGKFTTILSGEMLLSNAGTLNSSLNFQSYKLTLSGFVPTFKSANMNFVLNGIYSDGPVPFQMMYSLPGNIESVSQSFTMRTLRIGEVFGDRVLALSIEQNFNDEIFRMFNLSFLLDLQINLRMHFNAVLLEVSPKSRSIFPTGAGSLFNEFKSPFYEIGFGIGQALFPFRLEFTWKLNYLGTNNFVFGINTPML
ncbi:MAG: DUF5686 family protein [Melioribacteraceae bacterium]